MADLMGDGWSASLLNLVFVLAGYPPLPERLREARCDAPPPRPSHRELAEALDSDLAEICARAGTVKDKTIGQRMVHRWCVHEYGIEPCPDPPAAPPAPWGPPAAEDARGD